MYVVIYIFFQQIGECKSKKKLIAKSFYNRKFAILIKIMKKIKYKMKHIKVKCIERPDIEINDKFFYCAKTICKT